MNRQECDILNRILEEPYMNQRILAERSGYSLGMVNRSLKNLKDEGYLDSYVQPTAKAYELKKSHTPQQAVILAAGFGMRMVPINMETPKALVEVNGEPLIERVIHQLREAGIRNIYVVAGFMKEQFEYLIDQYDVELIINRDYASRNNLHSLVLAEKHLENCYVIPSDIYCRSNPFRTTELYSWYMVSEASTRESSVRINRKNELVEIGEEEYGNAMIGISYLDQKDGKMIADRLKEMDSMRKYENSFWEAALIENGRYRIAPRVVKERDAVELNTYEQLRELDSSSSQLQVDAMAVIQEALHVSLDEIRDIEVLKKGMTNRSFLFSCRGKKYIMRIPGEGTDQLISRSQEAAVYGVIGKEELCDNIIYMNPENGYKITEYMNHARVCDPSSEADLQACMKLLRSFHERHLEVGHRFDIFGQIEFYESLWNGAPSAYRDYTEAKAHVLELKEYIEQHRETVCLTHIDAVPDNFLFTEEMGLRLIDWEYAGMQDPHVDIAMFCIYALYEREQIDHLIDLYFEGKCTKEVRLKIYCYIAACGLLWSNWCEYKRSLGVEFGEYSLKQYRYAKTFYRIFREEYEHA